LQAKDRKRTYRIEDSAEDVHGAVEDNPAETHPFFKTLKTVDAGSVDNRNDTRDSETNEHRCTVWAPCGSTEALDP
jgi:hypothetical protein